MSNHAHHHHGDPTPGAKIATDPVCGMQVEMSESTRSRAYGGETYWFCSEGCEAKIEADPYVYASGNAETAVQKDQPGNHGQNPPSV